MFYISVLVSLALLGQVPPTGWILDTVEYPTYEECITASVERIPEVYIAVDMWFNGMGETLEVDCMTRKEFVKVNVELGHEESLFEDY
ncbi:MAG TPA: hypothetical protein EYP92_03070 [Candidatus Thioglobus sp.]|nr:hypothetical protein [Candidatus Thioglobus sp.]